MITTVVFDLDDTLYEEISYCRSGFEAVARFLAEKVASASSGEIFDSLWGQFTSGNHTQTFNTALDELNIEYDGELIAELVKVYRNHEPEISLPKDSSDILTGLSGKYTLAMLTDGFLPAQKLKVAALGIEKYFKCIVYTEELGREFWKPCPVGFEKIMEALNVKANEMVYIGDNESKDFIAPNKLGFRTIKLARDGHIHTSTSDDPDSKPQHVITSLDELPGLLESLK